VSDRAPEDTELVRLAKLVKLMRDAQRHYFAGDKSAVTLAMARQFEQRVDKAVKWVLEHRQGRLFDDASPGAYSDAPGKRS
jgi:hypothetical protein